MVGRFRHVVREQSQVTQATRTKTYQTMGLHEEGGAMIFSGNGCCQLERPCSCFMTDHVCTANTRTTRHYMGCTGWKAQRQHGLTLK